MSISVSTLAHVGASGKLHQDAIDNLQLRYGSSLCQTEDKISILYFLSGGSEAEAVSKLDKSKFQLLLASGKSNAYASAVEVKAYSNQNGFHNELLFLDEEKDRNRFEKYITAFDALDQLNGKRLGLIGEVSDWLVASNISPDLLMDKLGIDLIRIPWEEVRDFQQLPADESFLSCYHAGRQYNIEDAGKVNSMLKAVIEDHNLDAITVECFSLVQEKDVTACLSLSFLNDIGIPAGCEGDLCSIIGMMIAGGIIKEIPWMANIAGIKGNEILFAHCTAPTSVLSEYHINTHFETGKGTAIHGRYKDSDVTVFRLNNLLNKIFVAHGEVVDGLYEKYACRTQLHVEFSSGVIEEMKSNPLGNHHLILPGDVVEDLKIFGNIFL